MILNHHSTPFYHAHGSLGPLSPPLSTGLGFGLRVQYANNDKLGYAARSNKAFPVSNDGYVRFNIKGRCDADKDFEGRSLSRWGYSRDDIVSICTQPQTKTIVQQLANSNPTLISISRRICASILCPLLIFSPSTFALAREKRFRKNSIPIDDYLTSPDGLKYYDFIEGKGPVAEKGATVLVHFDCVYRGITAVSSRESKLLAGNRIIAQPYEFKVGSPPGRERKREYVENANGLFSAQAAPKPPPALYSITEGMRVGGKRTVIVPPEIGYGQKGSNEIPPGATFDLNIELLQVIQPEKNS